MKVRIEEYEGAFYVSLEAECVADAAQLCRLALQSRAHYGAAAVASAGADGRLTASMRFGRKAPPNRTSVIGGK